MKAPELMPAFARLDVSFVKGDGARLWDDQGREYLDALAGIAVCGLGHAHPAITKAICEQAESLTHISNLFYNQPQVNLAKKLCQVCGMDNVFFTNSGAEANEAAIKIARKYGRLQDIDCPTIIVMKGSFHGRTMATLSATGNPKVQEWFSPLVEGFIHVPFNDVDAVKKIANNKNIVAILVEPIQGEGGINIPASDYLNQLRDICDQHNWLLMVDEIQSGIGRTGKFLASQLNNVEVDVVTLAKGLGNGFPIGACLAKGKAAHVIEPGNHGTTFGGNPLACHTAEAVLDTIAEQHLMERAATLGERITQGLKSNLDDNALIKDIRHQGLLIGIELNQACGDVVTLALEKGLVLNVTAGCVIRLLPPLILSDQDADQIVAILTDILNCYSTPSSQ